MNNNTNIINEVYRLFAFDCVLKAGLEIDDDFSEVIPSSGHFEKEEFCNAGLVRNLICRLAPDDVDDLWEEYLAYWRKRMVREGKDCLPDGLFDPTQDEAVKIPDEAYKEYKVYATGQLSICLDDTGDEWQDQYSVEEHVIDYVYAKSPEEAVKMPSKDLDIPEECLHAEINTTEIVNKNGDRIAADVYFYEPYPEVRILGVRIEAPNGEVTTVEYSGQKGGKR